jgi:hypothetical protein
MNLPTPEEGRADNGPAPYEPRVPSDTMPPGRAALSVSWAALPFLTLGWATPFTFVLAALWRRNLRTVLPALAYCGVFAVETQLMRHHQTDNKLFSVCVVVLSVVACFHAFLIRRRVFDPTGMSGSVAGNEHAIEVVRRRRALRRQARDLARSDPAMARELRIGRPDLPRHFDDGGLVDVNHASVDGLCRLPGITRELAERIDRVRTDVGTFVSAEELSATAGLPPALTPELAEFALFLP